MKTTIRILLAVVALTGCGSSVTYECDAGVSPADDAAAPPPTGSLTARGACSWLGAIHGQQRALYAWECAPEPCPFTYDRTGRTTVVCDPAGVEACAWTLSTANTCETYRDAIAACAADCAVAP